MTKLLAKAFEEASQLPDHLQDELARELIAELTWEARWDHTLSESAGVLDDLADCALREHKEGQTKEAGFDEL